MKTRWISGLRTPSAAFVPTVAPSASTVIPWATQYAVLDAYYQNNGLYESLSSLLGGYGYADEAIRSLRNPTNAAINFYAAKLWPGNLPEALPIETENEAIVSFIEQIWTWSNWQSAKQEVARTFPKFGDMFLKVSTKRDDAGSITRVYIQNIPPASATKMDTDERGYLEYLRLDTPELVEDDNGNEKVVIVTEEWDKATQTYRRWRHEKSSTTPINRLGDPEQVLNFAQAWGGDFIPVVWQGFRLTGGERGEALITPVIDKIDELNRMTSALHRNIFRYNKPKTIVGREGTDAQGRPLPPVALGTSGSLTTSTNQDDEDIWILPGATTVSSLIPNLNYSDHILSIDKAMDNILLDLPELVYSMLHTIGGNPSSVSLQTLLLAATDRLLEARQNAESALIRAQQIALSIGGYAGLFTGIRPTDYDSGKLDHSFAEREIWTQSEMETAQTMQTYGSAGVPVQIAAQRAGWSEEQVKELVSAKEKAEQARHEQQIDLSAAKANQPIMLNGNRQMNGAVS